MTAMLTRARSWIAEQQNMTNKLQAQFQEARSKRDVVLALCLQDKIDQYNKVVSETAKGRINSLEAAVLRGDFESAQHEYTVLDYLKKRSQKIHGLGGNCFNQGSFYFGNLNVDLSIGIPMPPDDGTSSSLNLYAEMDVLPPQCVSCTGVLN